MEKRRQKRQNRVRAGLKKQRKNRLLVFRSNRYISAQVIDDATGNTIVGTTDSVIDKKLNKTERAVKVGETIAKLAVKKGIEEVVFDRNFYKYHGRIKALAEAARQNGLKF
ncbi:50S ribosomal protein L18 [Candidatus Dojkabacteria bacterium]|nr:50S ribosomal protein L18 [Candidatus Dojkabacteria bacterium]